MVNIEIIASALVLGFSVMLKDLCKNLFAGAWLIISSEFKKGDQVEFEKWKGEISGFSIRNIHIKLDDDRILIKESSEFLEADVVRKRRQ